MVTVVGHHLCGECTIRAPKQQTTNAIIQRLSPVSSSREQLSAKKSYCCDISCLPALTAFFFNYITIGTAQNRSTIRHLPMCPSKCRRLQLRFSSHHVSIFLRCFSQTCAALDWWRPDSWQHRCGVYTSSKSNDCVGFPSRPCA